MNKYYTKREIAGQLVCGKELKKLIMKSGYFLYHGRNRYPVAWNKHRIEQVNISLQAKKLHREGRIHFLVLAAKNVLNGKEI